MLTKDDANQGRILRVQKEFSGCLPDFNSEIFSSVQFSRSVVWGIFRRVLYHCCLLGSILLERKTVLGLYLTYEQTNVKWRKGTTETTKNLSVLVRKRDILREKIKFPLGS
ncbi:hypothetical protein CapIbe_004095 [Capra ibex]